MLQEYVRLMRPKHYIKNGLIVVPLIFGGLLFDATQLGAVIGAVVVFSLIASVIYIINDIRDVDEDRHHPVKKRRPLASGNVTIASASVFAVALLIIAAMLGILLKFNYVSWLLVLVYILINVGYSLGLKNIPVIDVALLASGFVIRILFGASVIGVEVSHWLYMTVLAGSFYASLGKRRNELKMTGSKSRRVNKKYTLDFLSKNMYVCLTLTLVFYSLWATDPTKGDSLLYLTIPLVMLVFMSYSYAIEKDDSTGDPVDVILKHKSLVASLIVFVLLTVALVYV